MTANVTPASTPLGRFVDWYEGLSTDLRAHIGAQLFRPGLPHLDGAAPGSEGVPRTRPTTMGSRMAPIESQPLHQAELVALLAARTDQVFADAAVKKLWTGEGRTDAQARANTSEASSYEQAFLGARGARDEDPSALRRAQEEVVARSMEWMRAAEQWAQLRETGLAARRIERWLAKRDHDAI